MHEGTTAQTVKASNIVHQAGDSGVFRAGLRPTCFPGFRSATDIGSLRAIVTMTSVGEKGGGGSGALIHLQTIRGDGNQFVHA